MIFGALTSFSLVGIASAKSYDITLDKPAMLGSTELKPGEYKVKIEGAEAVFTDARSAKSFSVPVKVETAAEATECQRSAFRWDCRLKSYNRDRIIL